MSESLPFLNLQNALPVDTSTSTAQAPPTTAPGADTAFAQELEQILAELGEKFHTSEQALQNQTVTTSTATKEGLPLVTKPVVPGQSPALLEQISSFQGNGNNSLPRADSADVFAAAKAIFGASDAIPKPVLNTPEGGSQLPQNGKSLPVPSPSLTINNDVNRVNESASPVTPTGSSASAAPALSQPLIPALIGHPDSVVTTAQSQPQPSIQSQLSGSVPPAAAGSANGSTNGSANGSANGSGLTGGDSGSGSGNGHGLAPSSQPGPAPVFSQSAQSPQSGQQPALSLQSFAQGVDMGSDKTVADVGGRAPSINVNLPAAPLNQAVSTTSGFERPLATFTLDAPVNSPEWTGKLADQLTLLTRGNIQQAQIRLHPAHLGLLDVKLVIDEDSTSITFVSQHAAVREALDVAIPRLREMLEQQGLELADVDISQYTESKESPENADNTDMAASQYRDGGADQDRDTAGEVSTKVSIDGLSVYA